MTVAAAPHAPQRLACAGCGAPSADPRAPFCDYCRAPLGTRACSSCQSRVATGVSFCPWCGHGTIEPVWEESAMSCPCGHPALRVRSVVVPDGTVGGTLSVADCAQCHGLWLGRETVERLVMSHAEDSIVLSLVPGLAATRAREARSAGDRAAVRYRRCPTCDAMMNRVNFARISGIIVDVCKQHGTWFDALELPAVLDFVRQGGLDTARKRETEALGDERRRLERERLMRSAMETTRGTHHHSLGASRVGTSSVGFFSLLGDLLSQ